MNIAILGAGSIARTMATTLQPLRDVTCYAVAARDINRAQVFADKFGFMHAYGSYTDMLEDPDVELVYIATPHSHHYEHIKMCLNHGKHVLCEKAFCANARQAEEVLRMAEERGLLLTEAMWTRYMPMRRTINAVIKTGMIGRPTSLSANLGYPLEHKERLMKLELCGGALMDLGVYVLNFASMVFGNDITGLAANCIKLDSGVDSQETIMLSYEDGRMATLYCTMVAQTDRRGFINGTNGYIEIENINNYESIRVYNLERKVIAQYAAPCQVTGYEYEVQSAIKAISEGQIECPEMTHYDTLVIMQLLDSIRAAWDLKFPYEVERLDSEPDLAHASDGVKADDVEIVDPNEQRIKEAKERVVPVEKPGRPMSVLPEGSTENTETKTHKSSGISVEKAMEKVAENNAVQSEASKSDLKEDYQEVKVEDSNEVVENSSEIDESAAVENTTEESIAEESKAGEKATAEESVAVDSATVDSTTEEIATEEIATEVIAAEEIATEEIVTEVIAAEVNPDEESTVEESITEDNSDDIVEELPEIEEVTFNDEEEFRIWTDEPEEDSNGSLEDDDFEDISEAAKPVEVDKYLNRLESMVSKAEGGRSRRRFRDRDRDNKDKDSRGRDRNSMDRDFDGRDSGDMNVPEDRNRNAESLQYDQDLYEWLDE